MRPPSLRLGRFGLGAAFTSLILAWGILPISYSQGQGPQNGPSNEPTMSMPGTDGNWKAKEAMLNGKPLGAPFLANTTLQLKGNHYEVKIGTKTDKGKCEIFTDTKPYRMKITGGEGSPNQGRSIGAIFEQKNPDELKVCYNLKLQEYPKAFESTEENGAFLATYERVK